MPRYEFVCEKCKTPFELIMTISEREKAKLTCPDRGGEAPLENPPYPPSQGGAGWNPPSCREVCQRTEQQGGAPMRTERALYGAFLYGANIPGGRTVTRESVKFALWNRPI